MEQPRLDGAVETFDQAQIITLLMRAEPNSFFPEIKCTAVMCVAVIDKIFSLHQLTCIICDSPETLGTISTVQHAYQVQDYLHDIFWL